MEIGLERLMREVPAELRGARVGMLTHAAAVDRQGRCAIDRLAAHPHVRLVRLFGAEHGLRGEHPAGEAVAHGRDGPTGLPVISLYGPERDGEMLAGLDAVLADLQDIGCRYYTFPSTLRRLLARAAAAGVVLWVLDRPNPLGRAVAGPVGVARGLRSPVGDFPVPVRHGRTLGELARIAAEEDGLPGAALRVLPMRSWRRTPFARWRRPWVPPSPNSTGPEMAELYPGTCLIEGTNLSEGRGTPYPFRQLGAPWLDGPRLAAVLAPVLPRGVRARPVFFRPTTSKHARTPCQGVFLDLVPGVPRPPDAGLRAGLAVLAAVRAYPQFDWVRHGGVHWLDRLIGSGELRRTLDADGDLQALAECWRSQAADWAADPPVDLYPA